MKKRKKDLVTWVSIVLANLTRKKFVVFTAPSINMSNLSNPFANCSVESETVIELTEITVI